MISLETAHGHARNHLSWSQINIAFFHSSVIAKLFNNSNFKNDYSKYKVIDCWKVIAKMNTKVILVLMNEFIWKVKYFFLDKL